MKNTKTLKLLVMVLSLALLIGSVVAVATSAAEDETYAIKSINISHDDSIMVLVAVDALGVDPATLEVKYTIGGGETKTATYYKNVDIYEDGNSYPVFYTEGIPMKDMGEDVRAEAHKAGTTPAAPQYKDVSVATYLYTKLYKEGYIGATEGEDLGRKNLYKNLLSYGAQAQEVLWNNNHPEAIRTLVTDVIPVFATDATIGGKSGLVKLDKAGYLDLKYTGSDLLTGWKVTTEEGTKLFYNNVYVEAGAKITPVTVKGGTAIEDFDGEYTTDDGTTRYNEIFFKSGFNAVSSPNGNATTTSNQKAAVNYEEGRGKYLQITSDVRLNDERAHIVNAPEAEIVTETPNVTIAEFDFKDNSTAYYDIEFTFAGALFALGRTIGASSTSKPYIELGTNVWNTVRLEAYHEENCVQVYLNDVYQGTLTTGYTGTAIDVTDAKKVVFGAYNGSRTVDFCIDNYSCVQTTKTYVAFPYTALRSGTVYDFESETAGVLGSTKSGLATYEFKDGVFKVVNNRPSTHTYPNKCSDGVEIVQDGDNKYFYMYAGKRVDTSNDRGWSFNNKVNAEMLVPEALANVGVLELDMKVDSLLTIDGATQGTATPINWSFYFGASKAIVRFDPTTSGTDFKLSSNTFMTYDAWYTVRLEFNSGDNTINVYSKPQGAADWTRSYTIAADATTIGGSMANISAGAFVGFDITGGNSGQQYSISLDNISIYNTRK